MRVVLCCLAKNEHLYINDFVKWYVNLGFDTIYIYDNDELGTKSIKECVDTNLLDKVVIKNIRGFKRDKLQHDIYTGFYAKYGKDFDWVFYCDVDEFLFGVDNIKDFLSNECFDYFDQIRVKWKLFGDDDLIDRDMSIPVYKAFTQEVKHTLNRNLIDKGNLEKQGKAFVRGKLNNVIVRSPHFASQITRSNILKSCLPSGIHCNSGVVINEDYSNENIYLHHYMTKSLSEFVNQKMNRTDAVFGNVNIKLDYYWRINKKTPQKLEWLKERGLL